MSARAMWKGVITFEDVRVPVKLYAAVQDQRVHFRLLHKKDHAPVRQALVHPDDDTPVDRDEIRRGYDTDAGDLVMLNQQELDTLMPEPSRDIEVLHFLPQKAIDHRWYSRPYYLGPDDDDEAYAALAQALAESEQEGLVRWVMRNKAYVGALRLHEGYPILVALRTSNEVIAQDQLEAPGGDALDDNEIAMAQQLIDMLAAAFEPEAYQDDYRDRVMAMIEAKARGEKVNVTPMRRRSASKNLTSALEASLRKERKRA